MTIVPDQLVVLEHRHSERVRSAGRSAEATRPGSRRDSPDRRERRQCGHGCACRDRLDQCRSCELGRSTGLRCALFDERRRRVMHGDRSKRIAVAQPDRAELGLAEPRRVLQHRLEHRLQARRANELMTCNTSAVAVCCCSDSRSSLSSRVFSMAMTAWCGEVAAPARSACR